MRLRRFDRLTYEVPPPANPGERMADAMFALVGRRGQSLATWRRRCEASRRASRRRRGLPVGGEEIVVRLGFDDRATARLREVDVQLRRVAGRPSVEVETADAEA